MPKRQQSRNEEKPVRSRHRRPVAEPTGALEPGVAPDTPTGSQTIAPAAVPNLQRTVGNRAVNRLLQRPRVQRDLATPPPTEAPEAQPDLTDAEINQAIYFNRNRYDADSTRLIQDIVGVEPTGRWDRDTVLMVAQIQEEYGLQKDGMVGTETFRFIDREQELEGADTSTEESLLLFKTPTGNVVPYYKNIGGDHYIEGHFEMEAQFSERENCGDWEYRQEIKGNAWAQRPGSPRININHYFDKLPAGSLTTSWEEDGNTDWAGINYGHRLQSGRGHNPINRYEDHEGNPDQRNGCVYKGEDYPGVSDQALISGDILTLELEFKGSIYRRNAETRRLEHVRTNRWTVNGSITVP